MTEPNDVKDLTGRRLVRRTRRCPHCTVEVFAEPFESHLGNDSEGDWTINVFNCPACGRLVIDIVQGKSMFYAGLFLGMEEGAAVHPAMPRTPARRPIAPEVPDRFRKVVIAAGAIIPDSPEASAALTRRALQEVLRERGGTTKRDLADEIQEVLDANALPSDLLIQLDGIRAIGNFGAHPMKSKSTGDIVEVEPGEADWNLETLEALLDWYYVRPGAIQKRRDELNAKLKDAGKPPIR